MAETNREEPLTTSENHHDEDMPKAQAVMTAEEALQRLRDGKTVENVRITRLHFNGEFLNPVVLKRCTLVRPRFDRAHFKDTVSFHSCTIERPHFGNHSTFDKGWDLGGSVLVKVQMLRLDITECLNMENCHVRGKFVINRSKLDKIRLWDAWFHGWVEIKATDFKSDVDFRSFHAQEGFILTNCHFHGHVRFRGASIAKKLDFSNSKFEGILDLSRTKLHDFTYLETIEQGENQRFAFGNIVGDRILIRTEQIEGRLASEEAGDYTDAMHEYAFLKRVFQTLHHYDREDWAFYRFKVNQRRCCDRTWWKPWTKVGQFMDWLVLDHGCGYCTNPFRAIRTALILILVFAAIYATNIEYFNKQDIELPFEGSITNWKNRLSISLFQSVATFTSGLSSISDMAQGWMNVPLMLESLLGILLWGLFIVAFSRKIIR